MIGIYRIRNVINDKCYYGSSKNINRRWSKHKSQLKNNRHENIILQRAWDKYGKDNIVFEVVELCEEFELLTREQKYLDSNPDYNIGVLANGGDNLTNHPEREKIVERIGKSINEYVGKFNKEERQKKWGRYGDENPNWRGGISVNHCLCGKRIGPDNTYCVNCVPKNGENNSFYGKKHSEETIKKLSEQNKGKYFGSQNICFLIDDVEYMSLSDASTKLDIPTTTIRWRLKSKNKKFDNYIYCMDN